MFSRKQITFDLDTNVLKQIHGEKNYTKAYTHIRTFMENNDFEHIEGSAYASINKMSNTKVLRLIADLQDKHEYLKKSVKDIHQTDIGESHSLNNHFEYDGTPGKFAQKDMSLKTTQADTSMSTSVADMAKRFEKTKSLTQNITHNDFDNNIETTF